MQPHCSESFWDSGTTNSVHEQCPILTLQFSILIMMKKISRRLVRRKREIVKERVHGLFKTGGFVHMLLLVLRQLKIEGQMPSKSSRKESYAWWVNFYPRSISFRSCWIVIYSSGCLRSMKLLSDATCRQTRSQNSLFSRDFNPMLLGSPYMADSTRVEVIGMMSELIHLGWNPTFMASFAQITKKKSMWVYNDNDNSFDFYYWHVLVLIFDLQEKNVRSARALTHRINKETSEALSQSSNKRSTRSNEVDLPIRRVRNTWPSHL